MNNNALNSRRASQLNKVRWGLQRAIHAIQLELNGVERRIRELDPTLSLGEGRRGQCQHCDAPCCEDCHGETCPACGEVWDDAFNEDAYERMYRP